jgi:adenine-specific DNA-methyltransferase
MSRVEQIGEATLYLGDCLEILPTIGQVDAVVTDPPYGKVKGEFDNAWTNRAAMLADAERWADAMIPRIKFNGSLWWFAWPSLAGRIEAMIAQRMSVLAHVVWEKPAPTGQKTRKETLRAPMPLTERIIFAEHFGADNRALGESGYEAKCDELRGFVFEPLRAYLADEWARAGLTKRDANECTGTQMAGHWFTTSQWALPTEENYRRLQDRANAGGGEYLRKDYEYLRKDYEELRKDYEELRKDYEELRKDYEELRRYFDCRPGDQFSDIWRFAPNTSSDGHPTQKPLRLMEYIVRLSVRPDGAVLDPFMGSGSTGVACANLGRKFIGIEIEPKYFDIACTRIEAAYAQGRLFA